MSSSAALWLLLGWTVWVGICTAIGIGFAGGIREAFGGNPGDILEAFVGDPFGIVFTASPLGAVAVWVEARRRERRERRESVEKPE